MRLRRRGRNNSSSKFSSKVFRNRLRRFETAAQRAAEAWF